MREASASVTGRETRGAFLKLTFQQQLDAICRDLQGEFWHEDTKLVAVSYDVSTQRNLHSLSR